VRTEETIDAVYHTGVTRIGRACRPMTIRIPLLLACVLVFSASSAYSQLRDDDVRTFAAELDRLRKEHRLPGLSAVIVKDRKPAWSQAYGSADDDVPMTTDTPLWIASVTKPFLGLLFLQLEAAGAVDLRDRINDVPGWDGLCQWLSGSGLPFGRDLRCAAPITIDHILHHTVNGEPGTRFLYNPVMYSRLSRYIEHKYGHPVDRAEGRHNQMARLVEERILAPAGMRRTMSSMWQREKMDVFFDMAQGFGANAGDVVRRPRPERHLAGGAGMVSTVDDLARFDVAMDTGVLGPPALMRKLFSPATTPAGGTLPYGYGWYIQEYRGETLYWHSGWDSDAGFSALYLKVPRRALTLILLANGEGLWWGNPLDSAAVEGSPFARAFLDQFVFVK
jgi:CubicO group peptidase (beta-lactamase class C family)